jgi:hypothetical protein
LSAWPIDLLLFGLGLNQWLRKHTSFNDDNIFLISAATPFLVAVFIGFAYIFTWPAEQPARLVWSIKCHDALPKGVMYNLGTRVGGITWEKWDIPLKIDLKIEDREVRNMDFTIVLDRGRTVIRDIGQINPFSEMTAVPTGELVWGSNKVVVSSAVILYGTATNGPEWSQVFESEKGNRLAPIWRIRFNRLPPSSEETILIAALRLGKTSLPDGRIVCVGINGTCDVTSYGTNATVTFDSEMGVKKEE